MKTTKKKDWRTPYVQTVEDKHVTEMIEVSACSSYIDSCHPSNWFIDAIPGKPPVEFM